MGSGKKGNADPCPNLRKLRLDQLQEAIRANQVSFPSQVPVFIKHSHGMQQAHMVLLYFVRGWSCEQIAQRYNVTRQHIWQIVSEWRRRRGGARLHPAHPAAGVPGAGLYRQLA